jgi:hypothetical protein
MDHIFMERMRTFQGTFHASPDYAMWYGWSEMQRDLTEIKDWRQICAKASKSHGPEIEQSGDGFVVCPTTLGQMMFAIALAS